MSTSRVSNERGMALAVAIFALVVIGALVAGTFFAGRLEQSSGQATVYAAQAAEAGEAGLSDAINGLTATSLGAMTVGDPPTALAPPDGGLPGVGDPLGPPAHELALPGGSAWHPLERRRCLLGRPTAWHVWFASCPRTSPSVPA